ncbi:MAG: ABC transporter ATP-binding protein [Candidatus Latescibacterota bacterium]|nr:MAG: ABC transporter ATP-binding protein [Candidatus Latescibacterota bacterium]
MSEIVLEQVTHYYGAERALDKVDLAIEDGVTTAVVGPSGSGKSTLLQLINGLIRPTKGRVCVFSKPIDYDALPGLRRQMGYAVQGIGLFPHMRVWDNITLLAKLEGWSANRIRERAESLLQGVGIDRHLGDRYPHELSVGQQQRVGLCRAMMLNPRIFLLDEPFGALDPITRNEIHVEFLKLQQAEARTIVFVTQDMREAVKLADRLVVLCEGRVVQHGTYAEICENPASDFVTTFIDAQLGEEEGNDMGTIDTVAFGYAGSDGSCGRGRSA